MVIRCLYHLIVHNSLNFAFLVVYFGPSEDQLKNLIRNVNIVLSVLIM